MRFGAHLPVLDLGDGIPDLGELRSFAADAEQLGYATLTVNDHHVFQRAWLDSLTALAAVISVTKRIGLGTSVTLPVVRGPVALAKTVAAIDRLSAGRLRVGVGPGSSAGDYAAVGLDFEERWKRLDEAVIALRALLRWETPPAGRYYQLADVRLEPPPASPAGPPIWIGSWGSAAGLRRVARLGDGWLASGYNTDPARFAAAWADLGDHLAAAGRPSAGFPNAIATMWTYVTDDPATANRLLRDVLAPLLRRNAEDLAAILTIGSPDDCVARLSAYAAAGAQEVMIWPLAEPRAQLAVFMERVAPQIA